MRADAKLRQTETLFAQIFHASPVAISIMDLTTRQYVEVNERFLSDFELCREEVIGRLFADLGLMLNNVDMERMTKMVREQVRGEFQLAVRIRSGRVLETVHSLEFVDFRGHPCVIVFAKGPRIPKSIEAS